ncbi:hypothetical protein DB41_DB00060 [Neochlamydia sp. TUME1]|nr:hypothetical protein DB41_DB00060 [Neochlamydia sp. TUME1]
MLSSKRATQRHFFKASAIAKNLLNIQADEYKNQVYEKIAVNSSL